MSLPHLVDLYRKSIGHRRWRGRILNFVDNEQEVLDKNEARAKIEQIAAALVARGTDRGDRIALWCEPRPEAMIVQFAASLTGAAVVPMSPAWSTEQTRRVMEDSDPSVIFASASTLSAHEGQIDLKQGSVVLLEDSIPVPLPPMACTWAQFLEIGRDVDDLTARVLRQRARAAKLEDPTMILYRHDESGTPLGVILSCDNILSGVANAMCILNLRGRETILLDRDWSDIAQQILMLAVISKEGTIVFPPAEPLAADAARRTARPTLRLQESSQLERELEMFCNADAPSKPRRDQLTQARRVATRRRQMVMNGKRLSLRHRFSYWLSKRSVFDKLRNHLTGDLRLIITGEETISQDHLTLLSAAGVEVCSVLGWPETSWIVAARKPLETAEATWDRIPQGIEFRTRYDGALSVRGSNVTTGYWRRPEKTAAVMDHRWFHTGITLWLYDDGALRTEGASLDDVGDARLVA